MAMKKTIIFGSLLFLFVFSLVSTASAQINVTINHINGQDNNSIINFTTQPDINFSMNSTVSYEANCSLYIDDVATNFNISVINGTSDIGNYSNLTTAPLSEGRHTVYVYCLNATDPLNDNVSSTWNFTIDLTAPTITLGPPPDNDWTSNTSINLTFKVTDVTSYNTSCSLWIDSLYNATNTSVNNDTDTTFYNIGDFAEANHTWNVTCNDSNAPYADFAEAVNRSNASDYYLYVDRTAPVVVLGPPPDNSWTNNASINLTFKTYDNLSFFMSCALWIDGLYNQTNTSVSNNTDTTFYNIGDFGDGNHSWNVTCNDSALNSGNASDYYLIVDRTAPVVDLGPPPDHDWTSNTSINLTFKTYDNLSYAMNCSLWIDGLYNATNTSVSNSTDTTFFNIGDFAEGNHTWNVTCNDTPIGNRGNASDYYLYVDRTAPVVDLGPPPDHDWTSNTSINLTFKTYDNMSFFQSCALWIDGLYNQTNTSVSNSTDTTFYNIGDFADGNHTWNVTCNDSALNRGNASDYYLYVDRTAPVVDLGPPPDHDWTSNTSINLTFKTYDNLSFAMSCSLWIDGLYNATNTSVSNSTDTTFFNIGDFAEGNHTWNVTCNDSVGNWGNASDYYLYVDRTAPVVDLGPPPNHDWTSNTSINLTFKTYDNLSFFQSCALWIDGLYNQTNTSVSNSTDTTFFNIGDFAEGNHTWNVTCNDSALNRGNASDYYLYVDRTAPVVDLGPPPDHDWTSNTSINLTFKTYDNLSFAMSCALWIDGLYNQTNTSVSNSTDTTFFNIGDFAEGNHTWNVTCNDTALNRGNASDYYLYVDRTPPVVDLGPPPDHDWTSNTSINLTFKTYDNMSFFMSCALWIDGLYNQTNTSVSNSTDTTFFNIGDFAEGNHTWNVTCNDSALNRGNASDYYLYVDRTPPVVVLGPPPNHDWTNNASINLTFNTYDNMSFFMSCALWIDGLYNQTNTSVSNNTDTTFYNIGDFAEGNHTWNVTCNDSALNRGNASDYRLYVDRTPPAIALISPAPGSTLFTNFAAVTYRPMDNMSFFMVCSLYVNGVLNQTNATASNNTADTFNVTNLAEGLYTWFMNCTDSANNSNVSVTWNFTINYCGDGICQASEGCGICPADCSCRPTRRSGKMLIFGPPGGQPPLDLVIVVGSDTIIIEGDERNPDTIVIQEGDDMTVTVLNKLGDPVDEVSVTLGDVTKITLPDGTVIFMSLSEGIMTLSAYKQGYQTTKVGVRVVEKATFRDLEDEAETPTQPTGVNIRTDTPEKDAGAIPPAIAPPEPSGDGGLPIIIIIIVIVIVIVIVFFFLRKRQVV